MLPVHVSLLSLVLTLTVVAIVTVGTYAVIFAFFGSTCATIETQTRITARVKDCKPHNWLQTTECVCACVEMCVYVWMHGCVCVCVCMRVCMCMWGQVVRIHLHCLFS